MESIRSLVVENPSGLFELKESLSIPQYIENFGFGLEKVSTIYESKKIHHSHEDWFAFAGKSLETLFRVQEESEGNLLVLYIVETVKDRRVYCHLILTDEAFKGILNDKSQHVLQVHQMYSKFWKDHIKINMETC